MKHVPLHLQALAGPPTWAKQVETYSRKRNGLLSEAALEVATTADLEAPHRIGNISHHQSHTTCPTIKSIHPRGARHPDRSNGEHDRKAEPQLLAPSVARNWGSDNEGVQDEEGHSCHDVQQAQRTLLKREVLSKEDGIMTDQNDVWHSSELVLPLAKQVLDQPLSRNQLVLDTHNDGGPEDACSPTRGVVCVARTAGWRYQRGTGHSHQQQILRQQPDMLYASSQLLGGVRLLVTEPGGGITCALQCNSSTAMKHNSRPLLSLGEAMLQATQGPVSASGANSPQPIQASKGLTTLPVPNPNPSKHQKASGTVTPRDMFSHAMALSAETDLPQNMHLRVHAFLKGCRRSSCAHMGEAAFKTHKASCDATHGRSHPLRRNERLVEWGMCFAVISTLDGLLDGTSIQVLCQICFNREEPMPLKDYITSCKSCPISVAHSLEVVILAGADNRSIERVPIIDWLLQQQTLCTMDGRGLSTD